MGFLEADLDVIGGAAQSMTDAKDRLHDVQKAMSKDGGADIGTKALNAAADEFQSTWHYGIEQITKAAKSTAEGLKRTHDQFQAADSSLADTIAQVGGDTQTAKS